ncbi:ABC transporter permease [Cellulomonas hominis]|uniref:ABC transporter permease n=1 Tax=Cellulomonas hominis TaxID=156981 RepID=UPI0014440376|nr:ABC transporter permease [Cellulomonas hominis]
MSAATATGTALRRETRTEVVDGSQLGPVTVRPPLGDYLAKLWERRHFIRADARARVVAGSRGTLLGTAWLVLRPVLDAAVYLVIFGLVLRSDRGIENFLGYLVIGTFMFQFTVRCLSTGAMSLISGRTLMKAFAFPRAALPVATVVRETLSYVPVLVAMVLVLFVLPEQPVLSWRWALVPLVVGLQVLMGLGLALLVARPTARVPDLQHIIGFLSRFWLYGSAVFFSYERFIQHPAALEAIQLNPMFRVLEITRDCLLYGVTPEADAWIILGVWSVSLVVLGTIVFWRGEERYGSL